MDISKLVNSFMLEKNSGKLDFKSLLNYKNKIKELIDKKFTIDEKNLFQLFLSDRTQFDKIFYVIVRRIKVKNSKI